MLPCQSHPREIQLICVICELFWYDISEDSACGGPLILIMEISLNPPANDMRFALKPNPIQNWS